MSDASGAIDGRRRLLIVGVGVLAVVVVAVILVWYFVFRDDSAASVVSDEAERARQEALEEARASREADDSSEPAPTATASTETDATDDSEPGGEGDPAPDGVGGTWVIDTSIGEFDSTCLTEVCNSTFVGFRIDEELASIGAKTVVGRTPGVSGSLTIEGAMVTSVEIVADMTGLVTDSGSRNSAIRRQAIETDRFPEARFVLTESIDLGAVPDAGAEIEVDATGELTIHGVTRTETIPLTASFDGTFVVVVGQLGPILLDDYDISEPRAAVVLSVEDNAIMELQLFFSRP